MAEALVGGAFLSASLQVLFDRMAPRDFKNFISRRKDGDRLLKKLTMTLLALRAVLNDAQDKQISNKAVNDWLDELQDAIYQADDLLDEISTKALQSKLDAESEGSTNQQVQGMTISRSTSSSNKDIESRIEDIINTLESFVKQKDIFGLKEDVGRKKWQRLQTTSLVDESDVYGRDNDRENIIQLLLSGNDIQVIPVVGMGGVGKTTLAQIVYNDARVDQNFHIKSWVCVSDAFDICMITKKIVDDVTASKNDFNNLDELQIKLKESLEGKKFLIVLDDIWNDNYIDWDLLRRPFRAGAQESRIIVTTRIDNVASVMGTVPSYYLKQLPFEDCWSLFAKHAFGNGDCMAHSDLERIGKEIVRQCKGLPLAIKSLGGLLRSKLDIEEWENILKSKIWDLESNILPALRLSYYYLPSHLKRCFAYCSIFPKDYKFEKKKLVRKWIAEELVQQPKGNKLLEDEGNYYFRELLSRSFFQRLSNTNSDFVMHDLIHDFAQHISGKFCFSLEDDKPLDHISEKVRHFSYIRGEYDAFEKFKAVNEVKCLRTFVSYSRVRQCYLLGNKVLHDILPSLGCLRVLSLSRYRISELPQSIENLIHLRYLSLSRTRIKRLPDSVTTLCHLQTLDLSYCGGLIELPVNMGKLIKLRYLDTRGTRLTEMPMQMSRLKDLQHLTYFVVGKNSGSSISELNGLCHLRGELCILGLQNVTSVSDALESILKDKKHLEGLVLEWDGNTNESQNERDVLDKLQPHAGLKNLKIFKYGGISFPDWLRGAHSFLRMVSLSLISCANCCSLPTIGQLPSLKYLRIEGMKAIKEVGREFYGDASSSIKPFPSLETLSFLEMSEWEEWYALGAGEFSCLLELSLVNCPKLTGELPNHVPSLKKIAISGCQRVVSNQVGQLVRHLSSLQKLNISGMSNLTELPMELQDHGSLQVLKISGMPNLKELLPEFYRKLERLNIEECPSLASFLDVGFPLSGEMEHHHTSIEVLKILKSCDLLESLPLGFFPKLRSLKISGCINFEALSIPDDEELQNLMELSINDCPKMVSLPHGGLPTPNLTFLKIWKCETLKSLPQRMHTLLPSLQSLYIEGCPEVDSFPDGGLPSNLRELVIDNCEKLMKGREGWGLQTLPSLGHFSIGGEYEEEELESFPEEWLFPTPLTFIWLGALPNLKALNHKGLQHLTSLKYLSIYKCPKLKCLPEEGLPNSLSYLSIDKCPLLKPRCQREKGEDWPKISLIRHIELDYCEDIVNFD